MIPIPYCGSLLDRSAKVATRPELACLDVEADPRSAWLAGLKAGLYEYRAAADTVLPASA
jgi:hypothetical protein